MQSVESILESVPKEVSDKLKDLRKAGSVVRGLAQKVITQEATAHTISRREAILLHSWTNTWMM